ncbi:MAG: ATP-dependent DNA helicase [Waddliaceae bacterium]|nr:ATP-dependent DNA helicase [Waddliaceae bacterium]
MDWTSLNTKQKEAVQSTQGRVLVLAGAGSGKTRVLTLRIVHLIEDHNISAQNILGLTFTNKAAKEMRHRIGQFLDPERAKQVHLATFHSFCMTVLREDIHRLGYTNKFTIYDEADVQRLLQMIIRDLLDHESELPSLGPTLAAIRKVRNQEKIKNIGSDWHEKFVQDASERLHQSMRAYNAVDFDGMLSLVVELFESFPDVLEKYQERYHYVLIDEYQDSNPTQYRLAELLTEKRKNLFVVGDDDQSIYGWRGADVQHILNFPDAKTIKLEQNYRSTNGVLRAANALIGHNTERYSKELWSEQGSRSLVHVFHAPTEKTEAEAVVYRMIQLRKHHGLKWRDMAILYRSNALSRSFEHELRRHTWQDGSRWRRGIPYEIYGGQAFYERREIKDLLAYMRVASNPKDEEAILRVINVPRRGVGENSLDQVTKYNRENHKPLWDVLEEVCDPFNSSVEVSLRARDGMSRFVSVIQQVRERFADGDLAGALHWLIEEIDYQQAIKEEVKSEKMRALKWENVEELVSALKDYQEEKQAKASLEEFLADSSLGQNRDDKTGDKDGEQVSLMTFHSAKGLEFGACFLVGVEDHIIPHEKSLMETGVEEERRLMYVGMTRAMRYLTISMARKRMRMGKLLPSRPSRFMFEIPKELLKMSSWEVDPWIL